MPRDEVASQKLLYARRKLAEAGKPVEEVEQAAHEVVGDHAEDFDGVLEQLRELLPNAEVRGRLKSVPSAMEKAERRDDKYEDPGDLQDVSGYAVVVETPDEIEPAAEAVRGALEVTEEDDSTEEAKEGGYRALHLTVTAEGLPREIQIRTRNMDAHARWQHAIYKPVTDEQKALREQDKERIEQVSSDVGDYYNALDQGEEPERPEVPDDMQLAFGTPWPNEADNAALGRWAKRKVGRA